MKISTSDTAESRKSGPLNKQAARAVSLKYVTDKVPGISRIRKGKGFIYMHQGKRVTNSKTLQRIRQLVIPPAWKNVWICPLENGHIQATGLDLLKRKQYRYHNLWSVLRNETKFDRLQEFGKQLPVLRSKIEKDFSKKDLSLENVLEIGRAHV